MRVIQFLVAVVITSVLVVLLNWHHPFGVPLPPIGKFISPFTGFWQNAEPSRTPDSQTLDFPSLKSKVEVTFDERLVPHLFAENINDLAFAQGYVTAMHRLFQMDLATRATAGRLSEVLGNQTLEYDRLQRRRGMVFAAENALKGWEHSAEEMTLLDAYTAGVNAYLTSLKPKDYPLEFKLLNYKPEPWTRLKSALFFKNMAQTLCGGDDDLETTNARTLFGEGLFKFLYPAYNPRQSPIIPAGTKWDFQPIAIRNDSAAMNPAIGEMIRHQPLPQAPEFVGSNNWAVSGKKTANGHPILCNDPHLNLTLPSIWYEIQLSTPEFNAYGVSLPGTPNIIIGFNQDIAWGVTNVGQDVVDWYKITWADKEKTKYKLDNEIKEVRIQYDTIIVRGKSTPVIEKVKYTVWGPVVYEDADSPLQDMAMRWVAHDQPEDRAFYDGGTFLHLMRAKNYDDYSKALEGFDSPAQNFVFACRNGDIAIKVNGKFPLKRQEQGRFVQDGSHSANAWQGFIPRAQVPQIRNPERGFVASANQNSTDTTYPYYYNGGFDDYRGRYINRRLAAMSGIVPQNVMDLQNDTYNLQAEDGLAVLLPLLQNQKLSKEAQELLKILQSWNLRFEKDAKAPVVYTRFFRATYVHTFDEIFQSKDSLTTLAPEPWRFFQLLKETPNHLIFDNKKTPAIENATAIVVESLEKVATDLKKAYPNNDFQWFKENNPIIGHLAKVAGLGTERLEVGGSGNSPNATSGSHGPSWRMVVELGLEVKAWAVYPGGQSGNPGSKYYDNMVSTWANGKYNELFFMKNAQDTRKTVLYKMEMKKGG